jgi:serine/threonine-protein kinase
LREARALARLSHPNLVPAHDVGETDDGLFFLAMTWIEGETLPRWLRQRDRTWQEILDVYLHAGRGLAAAHEAGVVHRHFQPSSVLVAAEGRRVFVTDFGALPASPAYVSPERLAGKPADVRSDVFSFCVSLWEGLYGTHPSSRNGTKDSDIPSRIRQALEKGLSASPDERPQRLDGLLDELQNERLQVLVEGALRGRLRPESRAALGFSRPGPRREALGSFLALVEHFVKSG